MEQGQAWYAIILGILQGTAEFLPISSSGHLILASYFLDGKTLPLSLNVALHVGTLSAVLIYFWRDWLALLNGVLRRVFKKEKNFHADVMLPALILGSIPAGVIGILWEEDIERIFHSPQFVVFPLALVGLLIWWGDAKAPVTKDLSKLNLKDAFLIGAAQAIALIPGTSRSGITIFGARMLQYEKLDAARFSFMLGTPAMLGAALLKSDEIIEGISDPTFYVGCLTSLVVGCLTIGFLMRFLKRFGFGVFAAYRILLAVLILMLLQAP